MAYDFTFSEEQQLLKTEAARAIRERIPFEIARRAEEEGLAHTLPLWKELSNLGYAGLCGAEPEGSAAGVLGLLLFATELGRRAAPLPFIHHNAALLHLGSAAPGRDVSRYCSGECVITVAHTEGDGHHDLTGLATVIEVAGGEVSVRGTKYFVPFAGVATDLLVTGRTPDGSYATAIVPVAATSAAPYRSTGKAGRAIITIDARLPDDAVVFQGEGAALTRLLDGLRIGLAGFIAGASSEATEMTAAYVRERIVFGRPLGTLQAVQHRAADMLMDAEAQHLLAIEAAWRIDEGRDVDGAVDAACGYIVDGSQRVFAQAHQLHGAIGFTYEYDLQLLSTAVKDYVADLGRVDILQEAVAATLGL